MSVEGFNRQRKRVRKHMGDFIVIHFDPEKTDLLEVGRFMEAINNIPERHQGTLFAIEPEGMYFRRV